MDKLTVSEIDNINFFFILGRPRSGTTLLSSVLAAHPNLQVSAETKLVIELYFKFRNVKTWNEKKLLELFNFVFTLPRVKYIEIDKDKLKSDILNIGNNANLARLIKIVYLNINTYYTKDKIIWIGDKTPNYSIQKHYLKIFKELFPQTKVVHLVRDYRDHYLSVQKVNFKFKQRAIVAYRWIYSYNIITNEFKGDSYYYIRHEDLVSEPEKYLTQVCNFLGIEYKSEILEFYKIKDKIMELVPKDLYEKFHSRLLQPITDKYIYGWKTKMDKSIVKDMDEIVGEYAEKLGYEREFKTKPSTFLMLDLEFWIGIIAFLTEIADKYPYKIRKVMNYFILLFSYVHIKFLKV